MQIRTVVVLLSTALALSTSVEAQYIQPGSTAPSGDIIRREVLQEALQEARWHFGGFHLAPWLGLRDAAYVTNQQRIDEQDDPFEESDFTATVGAGLRAYSQAGAKVMLAAHALPEYTWWADIEEKRNFNGRFGFGLFGYFNRLTVEASLRRLEQQSFFSPEVQELTSSRNDVARLALALGLGRRIEVFGSFIRTDVEAEEDESPLFARLDRSDDSLRGGLRYKASDHWSVRLGWSDQSTDFEEAARNLSNSDQATFLEASFSSNKLGASLLIEDRSLEPEDNSELVAADETTGRLELVFNLGRRLSILAYDRRDLYYSVDDLTSYVLAERLGSRLELRGQRASLGFFGEVGEDDFQAVRGATASRLDDVTAFGVEIDAELGRLFVVSIDVTRTDYDSSTDALDREVTTIGATLQLGKLQERLRIGRDDGTW